MESPTRAGRMKRKLSGEQERDDEAHRPAGGTKRPRDGSLDRPPSLHEATSGNDIDKKEAGGSPVSLKTKDDEPLAKISPTLKPVKRDDISTETVDMDSKAPPLKRKHSLVEAGDEVVERPTGIQKRLDENLLEEKVHEEEDELEPMDVTVHAAEPPAVAGAADLKPATNIAPAEISEDKSASKPFVNGFAAWKQGGLGTFTPYSFGGTGASAAPAVGSSATASAFGGTGAGAFGGGTNAGNAFGGSSVASAFGGTSTRTAVSGKALGSAFGSKPAAPSFSANPLANKISSSSMNGFEGFAAKNPLSFLAKSPVGENIDTVPKVDVFKSLSPRSFGAAPEASKSGPSASIFGQPKASPFHESPFERSAGPASRESVPALSSESSTPATSSDPFTYVPEKTEDVFGRKRGGTPQPEPASKGDRYIGEGEEGEFTKDSTRAVLYAVSKDGGYTKRGVGLLKLNVRSSDGKARLIMRLDAVLRTILNVRLYRDMSFIAENKGLTLKFGYFDGSEYTHFGLKFGKSDDGMRFFDNINDCLPQQPLRTTTSVSKPAADDESLAPSASKEGSSPAVAEDDADSEPESTPSTKSGSAKEGADDSDEAEEEEVEAGAKAQNEDDEEKPATAAAPKSEKATTSSADEPSAAKTAADESDEDSAAAGSSDDAGDEEEKADAEGVEAALGKTDDDLEKGEAETAEAPDHHTALQSSPSKKRPAEDDSADTAANTSVTKEMKRMRVHEGEAAEKSDPAEVKVDEKETSDKVTPATVNEQADDEDDTVEGNEVSEDVEAEVTKAIADTEEENIPASTA